MLPQHGGVPNFNLKIPAPLLILFALVLITGGLLTLSLHLHTDEGDVTAQSRVKLSLIITLLLAIIVFLAGTGRWWHPHLWKGRRQHHRHRSGHHNRR
jgi:hypothetical protein